MCGRYAYILPPDAMLALFKILNELIYPPRYNIAPTQPIPVVWEQQGRRTAQLVRWGFVPGWVKDPREFPLLINARSEGMAEKPAFRDALKHQRCVIPASGYYEWMKRPDGSKQPYYITEADGRTMAFAGLYSTWMGPEGEEIDTAAACRRCCAARKRWTTGSMSARCGRTKRSCWRCRRHRAR
jgi:putative SOS response-associated peptidase YedK